MQQDTEEFLRLLCERLEELLKGTEYVRYRMLSEADSGKKEAD